MDVPKALLARLSAVAAVLSGGLRVADAFLPAGVDAQLQQFAYFATDLMFIFALCGIYLTRSHRLGLIGLLGFASSITGLLVVRSFGAGAYLLGATVTLLGVVAMGVVMLVRKAFPKWAPILWITSLIVGVVGLLPAGKNFGVTLAGVIFGIGFVAAGISLLGEARDLPAADSSSPDSGSV